MKTHPHYLKKNKFISNNNTGIQSNAGYIYFMKNEEREIFEKLMSGNIGHEIAKPPAFQLYVEKFLVGTLNFNSSCTGAYILLLCYQWDLYSLPSDKSELMDIGRCNEKDLEKVLKKFTLCNDGNYRNEKLEKIRAEQIFKRYSRVNSGKNGAEIRWSSKKEEVKEVKANNEKSVEPGYFFYIGTDMFSCKISEYIKENMQRYIEEWTLHKKPSNLKLLFDTLDKENVGKAFSNQQHIKNTLSKTLELLNKQSSAYTTKQMPTVATAPTPVKRM